jgi:hypothetical protein
VCVLHVVLLAFLFVDDSGDNQAMVCGCNEGLPPQATERFIFLFLVLFVQMRSAGHVTAFVFTTALRTCKYIPFSLEWNMSLQCMNWSLTFSTSKSYLSSVCTC